MGRIQDPTHRDARQSGSAPNLERFDGAGQERHRRARAAYLAAGLRERLLLVAQLHRGQVLDVV